MPDKHGHYTQDELTLLLDFLDEQLIILDDNVKAYKQLPANLQIKATVGQVKYWQSRIDTIKWLADIAVSRQQPC